MLNNIVGLLAPQVMVVANSYESIATTTVGAGGTSSITFDLTSVSGYKHLQIRTMVLRTTNPGILISVNGNTTAGNYPQHILYGDGASAAAYADITNYTGLVWMMNDVANTTMPAVSIIDILDYANTSKLKTFRAISGGDKNGSGTINLASGFNKTISAAITSITISGAGANFNQYSSFALYGIKG